MTASSKTSSCCGRRLALRSPDLGTGSSTPTSTGTKVDAFTEGLASYFKDNARRVPMAIWRLRRFTHQYARYFDDYDVLMNPTVAMPPPEHGFLGPEVPFETSLERLKWFIPFHADSECVGGAGHFAAPRPEPRRITARRAVRDAESETNEHFCSWPSRSRLPRLGRASCSKGSLVQRPRLYQFVRARFVKTTFAEPVDLTGKKIVVTGREPGLPRV